MPWTQLEAGLDDRPLRRVDHDRDRADVGLRRDAGCRKRVIAAAESSIASSMLTSIDLGAGLDLLAGDLDGLVEAVLEDQLRELARAGDVRPLADVDEDVAGLRDRRAARGRTGGSCGSISGGTARRQARDGLGDRPDVGRRRAAAAADDVDAGRRGRSRRGRWAIVSGVLVVAAELVGQAGVRVGETGSVGDPRQLRDVRPELPRAERAVQADGDRPGVRDRCPERLDGLAASVRPDASVIVPRDDQRERGRRPRRRRASTPKIAALPLSVSKIVSMSRMSAPPSIRPSAASW